MSTQQKSLVIVDHVRKTRLDKNIEVNVTVFNDGIHDSLLNVSLFYSVKVFAMKVAWEIRIPENDEDDQYRKIFMRSNVDVGKMITNLKGIPVVTSILSNVIKSMSSMPSFPFPAVKFSST